MSWLLKISFAALAAFLLVCQYYAPVTPLRLKQPAITKIFLSEAKFSTYREALHIVWSPPPTDSISIRSYTLLRKTYNDSIFAVLKYGIPDSIVSFNDDLTLVGFPVDGYDLIEYKLFAIDTLGRPGDTSAACSLYIAPQPELTALDTTTWCFGWLSRSIQGSVDSYIKVWNSAGDSLWTSPSVEEFGNAQVPVNFSACIPDSLIPSLPDTWYFAIFLDANGSEHQSMKVGSFNVPSIRSAFFPGLTAGVAISLFAGGTFSAPVTRSAIGASNSIVRTIKTTPALSQKNALLSNISGIPFTVGLKIDVNADGIYELSYQSLKQAGVPVASIPSRFYRLFEQNKEIPLYLTTPENSPLQPGDKILFYGRFLRGNSSYFTQFSFTDAYWLTWNDTIVGIRTAVVSGELRVDEKNYSLGGAIDLNAHDFYDTIHLEEDNDIEWLGSIGTPSEMTEGTTPDSTLDIWYWGLIGATELTDFTVSLPSPSPSLTGTARIRVGFMGLTSVDSIADDHQVTVLVNNNPAGGNNTAVWDGQQAFVFTSDTFPVSRLQNGKNDVSFIVKNRGFEDRSALNWIEFEYPRTYRALDNTAVFKSSDNGVNQTVQFDIPGFSSQSIDLWDIKKNRLFTGFAVNQGSGLDRSFFTLTFQDSTDEPVAYWAQTVDKRCSPAAMRLDTIKNNWATLAGTDYVAIGPAAFRTTLQPLLDVHAKNGLQTVFVDIEDLYNSFSCGVRDPESIRSFIAMLFALSPNHPPRFLLLAGDCTSDLYKKYADRTLVPTHLSIVPGWGPASNDDYFGTVGNDQFADLCVGRFPAETQAQLKVMVDKTVAYITKPDRGFWRDNLLLASGYESTFTASTNDLSSQVIGPRMNVLRMDADPASPWYKDEFSSSTTMAGFINAGVYALCFYGHGGGNVWSDSRFFSYTDLDKLHNGQWGASGRLPIVFSFTCLTGFFESDEYRSLGEEFVRTDENGAICFYGASGYTSINGNAMLERTIVENGLSGNFTTVGELVHFCEANLLVSGGTGYLPLTREYNLLGDPALPWRLTPDSLRCTLTKGALAAGDSLQVHGVCNPVKSGSASVLVESGNSTWNRGIVTLQNGTFSQSFFIKDSVKTASGIVRAYAWNDSAEVRGWAEFSKDTIMIRNLQITPAACSFGDSVTVSCALSLPPAVTGATILCLYAIASPNAANVTYQSVRMAQDSGTTDTWTTIQKIPLIFTNDVTQMLLVYFRVVAGTLSKESSVSSFTIAGKPDLTFSSGAFSIVWQNDSLRLKLQVLNIGNAAAPPFGVTVFRNDENSGDTAAIVRSGDSLLPTKTWSGSVAVPDSQGMLRYTGIINAGRGFGEISFDNNRSACSLHVVFRDLHTTNDTLSSAGGGLLIAPARNLAASHRVFLFDGPLTAAAPLQTASKWLRLKGDSITGFQLHCRPILGNGDTLAWMFRSDSLPAGFAPGIAQTGTGKLAVMQFDSLISAWRYAGGAWEGAPQNFLLNNPAGGGPFALAFLEDLRPPDIQITVFGRELNALDYVAKDKPFNIMLADASGVLPGSVLLALNKTPLAKTQVSTVPGNTDLRAITVTAYLTPQRPVDSLAVTAEDLAGNKTTSYFAYIPGQNLSIKFLTCHPNPFSLRARGVNGPPQQVRFAFELTDNADEIDLGIYTVTGKKIASFRYNDMNGYNEIPWDGRDGDGYRIANGTYYCKLTARNSQRTVTKRIRIAKLEGY